MIKNQILPDLVEISGEFIKDEWQAFPIYNAGILNMHEQSKSTCWAN